MLSRPTAPAGAPAQDPPRRLSAWLAAVVSALLAPSPSVGAENTAAVSPAGRRPNVVVILTDDQGYGDLGSSGNTVLRTPRLDRLARQSVRWEYFYVSPVCTPTRASLMTGRYNYRTRAIDTYRGRAMMEPSEVTVAEMLRPAGYATGIFGKWHLGDCYPMRPRDQGFEESLVHRGGGIAQPADPPGAEGKYTDPMLLHNGRLVQTQGYCTDVYFREGMRWAETAARQGRPFFLYLATNCPHSPYRDVPREKYEYYKRQRIAADVFPPSPGHPHAPRPDADVLARVYAMIDNIDENVGRLDDWLAKTGLADNTLVFFLTDNGEATAGYNAGLRGHKADVYEGGIRSPLFVRWPAKLKPRLVERRIAAHIDLTPTILDACGVSTPREVRFDGRSLLPLLARDVPDWPDRTLFFQAHRGDVPVAWHNAAVRTDRWKLVRNSGFGRTEPPPGAPWELFDMASDPYEMRDATAAHPEVVARLKARYAAWFADVGRTRPDNYAPPRIPLGASGDEPVVLSRQDWRGADWGPNDRGHWEVSVARGGDYRVTVRFQAGARDETLRLACGEARAEKTVAAGVGQTVFDGVRLTPGPARLEAFLSGGAESKPRGVTFVEVERAH
jgi:arylsulfatase A-like enzyme